MRADRTGGLGARSAAAAQCAGFLLFAAAACRDAADPRIAPGRVVPADGRPERALVALIPPQAEVGEIFQRQPDGRAALAVFGTGFAAGDVICWNGRPLSTTAGGALVLTAPIPAELLAAPGEIEITVANRDRAELSTLRATFHLLGPKRVPSPGGH